MLAAVAVVVVGCAAISAKGSVFDIQARAPGQFSDIEDDGLCLSYGDSPGAAMREEITRRGIIKPAMWSVIDAGSVSVGMTTCAILASYGMHVYPNRTVTAYGEHVQWVANGRQYIYTDNGIVTAIQN